MQYAKDLISEVLKRAEKKMMVVGTFEPIELTIANSNQYQHVEKFGIKIQVFGVDNNSSDRLLEFVPTTNTPGCRTTCSVTYSSGTRDEILSKLNSHNIIEDFGNFVRECNNDFFWGKKD